MSKVMPPDYVALPVGERPLFDELEAIMWGQYLAIGYVPDDPLALPRLDREEYRRMISWVFGRKLDHVLISIKARYTSAPIPRRPYGPTSPDPTYPPPSKGQDPEFDEIAARTLEGLTAAGNPESVTEENVRHLLARAIGEKGGRRAEGTK